MALGGYKFAGHSVAKPEGATNTDWVLLCHKCRLKAFIDASTVASAGWVFDPDQSSGEIAFSSYGNVIYRLDDLGYNLVSFFKHGTGDAYFAICTFTYYSSAADTANGQIKLVLPQGSSSTYQVGRGCTMFHVISTVQLNTTNVLSPSTGNLGPLCAGRLVSKSTSYYPSPSNWSVSGWYVYVTYTTFCSGYAIKGSNVISFLKILPSETTLNVAIYSVGGYASLCNPNDDYNIFALNIQSEATSSDQMEAQALVNGSSTSSVIIPFRGFWSADNTGSRGVGAYYMRIAFFSHNAGSIQYYPFEPIYVISNVMNSVYLNAGKGVIDPEFLAVSSPALATSIPTRFSTTANGNYLFLVGGSITGSAANVSNFLNSTTYISQSYPCLYCGWDASNPDVTTEGAFPSYDGN